MIVSMYQQGFIDIKTGLCCPLRHLQLQSAFVDRFGALYVNNISLSYKTF